MMNEKVLQKADTEQVLKGILIPPRPAILVDINDELQRPNPNLTNISKRIATDPGISSAILKVVNSPFFGLQNKMGSIANAVQTLGVNNVKSIVTGLVLRSAVGGKDTSLDKFWDSAEKVARVSAYIASTLPKGPRDAAYTFGLFRDCAIPILLQRFPSYKDTLSIPTSESCPLTVVENAHLDTNHAIVGQMVANHWGLPASISEAIARHHDVTVFDAGDPMSAARILVAINFLAEHLQEDPSGLGYDPQWPRVGEQVLEHLGLDADELIELKDDIDTLLR